MDMTCNRGGAPCKKEGDGNGSTKEGKEANA